MVAKRNIYKLPLLAIWGEEEDNNDDDDDEDGDHDDDYGIVVAKARQCNARQWQTATFKQTGQQNKKSSVKEN